MNELFSDDSKNKLLTLYNQSKVVQHINEGKDYKIKVEASKDTIFKKDDTLREWYNNINF